MLELRDVGVSFSSTGVTQAVKDVTLKIVPGKHTVLIGETGSGKSVLLQAILGLLPPTARVSGQVFLESRNLLTLSEKEMRKIRGAVIGYVPQGNGLAMNPLLTIGFQVGEPLMEHRGFKRKDAVMESISLLKKFNVGNEETLVKEYPQVLSGGMRQRVMLAMGIAAQAPYILADEPTKGLDKSRVGLVINAFRELKDKALLCVTHDLEFAEAVADEVCVMYAANQLETCGKEEFFENPLHPYSRALLESRPSKGLKYRMKFAPPRDCARNYGCIFGGDCPVREERCRQIPPMVEIGRRKVRCWKYVS